MAPGWTGTSALGGGVSTDLYLPGYRAQHRAGPQEGCVHSWGPEATECIGR